MNAKSLPASEVHLFVCELLADTRVSSAHGNGALRCKAPLILSGGINRLHRSVEGIPSLAPVTENAWETSEPLLEALAGRGTGLRVLLLSPKERRACVNGVTAPRLVVLNKGDRFHFDDSYSFDVAIYRRPFWGPVPEQYAGVACPVCTIP